MLSDIIIIETTPTLFRFFKLTIRKKKTHVFEMPSLLSVQSMSQPTYMPSSCPYKIVSLVMEEILLLKYKQFRYTKTPFTMGYYNLF